MKNYTFVAWKQVLHDNHTETVLFIDGELHPKTKADLIQVLRLCRNGIVHPVRRCGEYVTKTKLGYRVTIVSPRKFKSADYKFNIALYHFLRGRGESYNHDGRYVFDHDHPFFSIYNPELLPVSSKADTREWYSGLSDA